VGLRPAQILATPDTKLAEVMRAGGMVPELRAYLLIKRHGQELCKASRPKCEQCPVTSDCNYFRSQRSGE
jgi:endonuclease III